jgi:hypothetical protein
VGTYRKKATQSKADFQGRHNSDKKMDKTDLTNGNFGEKSTQSQTEKIPF